MALGANYATTQELKDRLSIEDVLDDSRLAEAVTTASREVERHCKRQFNDAGSVSARYFEANSAEMIVTDDFHTVAPVITTVTYADVSTDVAVADYRLEPLNGISHGTTGWPWWRIRTNRYYSWPDPSDERVQVVARWGWPAVPGPIKEATLILAEEFAKMKDAPFGVINWGEYGPMRIQDNKRVLTLLRSYKRGMMVY